MEHNTKKMELVAITPETHKVKTFRFRPLKGSVDDFLPGQFVFLYSTVNGEKIRRAYSIASSPLDNSYIELTIEIVKNGKMSTFMFNGIKEGDIFEIGSPMGKFIYDISEKSIVMIAGGSGIVPMRCITRYCTQKKLDTKIKIIHSIRTPDDMIYGNEFEEMQKKNNNIEIIYTVTRDKSWPGNKGRVNRKLILDNIDDIDNNTYYLCGPLGLIRECASILKKEGVDRKKIKRDVWG